MRARRWFSPALLVAVGLTAALGLGAPAAARANRAGYVFAPYVDMTGDPVPDLPALAARSGAHHLSLGFVVTPAPGWCSPTWSGVLADPAWGPTAYQRANVAALEATGAGVAISFGGEYGIEPAEGCLTTSALYDAYATTIAAYAPTRLDFDIEGADLTDTAATIRRARVLATIERQMAAVHRSMLVSFTVPATPSGLTPDALALLADTLAQGVRIDYVNLMTMDFVGAPSPAHSMSGTAIDAAAAAVRQLTPLLPAGGRSGLTRKIGLTPMIGRNDVPGEVFTVADARRLATAARIAGVGMVSMWQLARDSSCAAAPAPADCSGVTQQPFQFASALGAGPPTSIGALPSHALSATGSSSASTAR